MLSPVEARQLDRLAFGASSVAPADTASGARVARARGFGLEFREFRRYEPGDDPRAIDWMIHARLRQLVVRVYRADAHLRVHLLVDTSASMATGTPSKLTAARTLAAVLSYVAVRRQETVGISNFDATIRGHVASSSGRTQLLRIFEWLNRTAAHGRSSVNRALADYGATVHGPGLAIVISDFYEAAGSFEGLRYLLHRGLTPVVAQVVAPQELDPQVAGELELRDAEDPEAPPIIVDSTSMAAYHDRMAALAVALSAFCLGHGLPYLRVDSSFGFDRLVGVCIDAGVLAGAA